MMVTAETLTDEQIDQLATEAGRDIDLAMCCKEAKFKPDTEYQAHREYARKRCASVWNYRHGWRTP